MALPVNGVAYNFTIQLVDSSNPADFLASPTLATGDFKVSINGGALANLTNLPVNSPGGSIFVDVSLTASEMTGSKVNVVCIDAAGAEWEDIAANIDVPEDTSESVLDILEGDHTETRLSVVIKKKGTSTELINKRITGSLLSPSVTILTEEP